MAEIGGHHSDDGVAILVHADSASDDVRIAAELALPQAVADHHSIQESRPPVGLPVHLPDGGGGAQQLEVVRAGAEHLDPLDTVAAGKRGADRVDEADLLKGAGALAQVIDLGHGHADVFGSGAAQVVKHADQAIGLAERQGLEQHRINQGKDSDVAADSQGQGQHGNRQKRRAFTQRSRGVNQILHQNLHIPLYKSASISLTRCMVFSSRL